MKRFIKNNVFGFIIGLIVASGIGVYASITFKSEDIIYNDTTVKNAIDDLYLQSSNGKAITSIAKDVNGYNAEAHYYGVRISGTTRTFTMNKGKYILFVFTTYNRWLDGTNVGGDTTNQTRVSLSNGTATKINDYAYIVDVTSNSTPVNVSIVSYGNDEDQRTIYEMCFYN